MNLLDRADRLQVDISLMGEELEGIKTQLKKEMGIIKTVIPGKKKKHKRFKVRL